MRHLHTRVAAVLAAVLAVLLVVAGCSSGDEADDADAPSPSSAVTREPSVPDSPEPASPDLAQVCALVTPGELEAIVGAPVTDGVVQDSGWGSPECRFESLDGVPANGSVTVAVAPGVRDGVELFPTPLVSSFHVGGHEADWHQETGLLVVVADQQPPWLLHAVVRLEHRNREAESIDLAELVVSRLPLLLDGRRVCRLFRADDFEDVFGARTTARPPRVFTSPMSLGDCVFPSRSGAGRLELGAYVARVPGGPAIAPVESLSRRVTGLGPRTFWHPRSGVSVDLAGQGVVWLRVAATRNTERPDRSLSIAAARIVLERLDAPATPPG